MNFRKLLFLALFILPLAARAAAEFDTGGSNKPAPSARSNDAAAPQILEAGDVPSAYAMLKYELRSDVRFYSGGGILSKMNLGIFSRFSIGGGLNVSNLIGSGQVNLSRDDAQLCARLLALKEDEAFPAVSLGWDGPAYAGSELRGLYLALSKEFATPLGYFQAHGGLNTSVFEGFQASRDLRGFAALTTSFQQVTLFFEADELIHPAGPRLNSGGRVFFDPISLGVEFRDLGGTRNNAQVSRMLRVAYTGLF